MEDNSAEGDERQSLLSVLFSTPPAILSPADFSSEIPGESKALSMASNDCSPVLSSPTEASPAKPGRTSTLFDASTASSPPTSHIASAPRNAVSIPKSIVTVSESLPSLPMPSKPFGAADPEKELPSTLSVNGVSVTLENESVWKQFYSCGTEMVLTKGGRRMFPYCRYHLSGLDPDRLYSLILSIVPFGQDRYHWNGKRWEVYGKAKQHSLVLNQAFSHHHSPHPGSVWMGSSVSFYKLKLTNHSQDMDEHIVLHSLHRYIPRLHVIPVADKHVPSPDNTVVLGPESMTFTFPQTEFVTVTTYQNFQITQLKINHNPFAKGFREDGKNPRLHRISKDDTAEPQPDAQPVDCNEREEALDLSLKKAAACDESKLVLKPIMSTSACKDESYAVRIQGKHSLAELVLIDKPKHKDADAAAAVGPEAQNDPDAPTWAETPSVSKTPATSTPTSSPKLCRKRKRINKHWGNSKGKEWYRKGAFPKVQSPLMTSMSQLELDEVEGMLFVSFSSKEDLEIHIKDNAATNPSPSPAVSPATPTESEQTTELNLETEQEKIARLESVLLNDLRSFKHKQVIHPVLQEVGLKLTLLDTSRAIDLQYLGVCLPVPPTDAQDHTPGDDGSPFISRTGKTSDVTKIKGWKNKFAKGKETSPSKNEGLAKDLSAFCSDLLDEYLESEAQQITERAAAFSTDLEGSVSYQLPVKSSSYVKTLDSALRHRNTASTIPVKAKRPPAMPDKPVPSSAVMSSPPPLANSPTLSKAGASSRMCSTPIKEVGQNQPLSFVQMALKSHVTSKVQMKMMQMESAAKNRGLLGTRLTPDRLTVALSVMLTKETEYGQVLKIAAFPKDGASEPQCGKDYCRLGCVCSSLQYPTKGRLHCRLPECMFACTCFKRKITKQGAARECEQQIHPVYSMSNSERVVPLSPPCRSNKLWNSSIDGLDPEPNFTATRRSLLPKPRKEPKNNSHFPPQAIPEEEKDPVYKYFESLMTCARVREFNMPQPEPQHTPEPKRVVLPTPSPEKINHSLQKDVPSEMKENTEKTSQGAGLTRNGVKMKIQVQSLCSWGNDRVMVLKALCERMYQNRLEKPFGVGPYCVSLINKVLMQKPSGSVLTYRVKICKQSSSSASEEVEHDGSEGEQDFGDSLGEEQQRTFGVMPFMSGVLPAGQLRARKKTATGQTHGLVQVNGKSYNQARLLLGNIGSLHPANRLAAFVTGRLPMPNILQKSSGKHKVNPVGGQHIKAEDPVVQSPASTDHSTDVKPPPTLQASELGKIGLGACSQQPQSNSNPDPLPSPSSNQHGFSTVFQSSPLSLTVSPSLKSPSFLGEKGTYSFRICPPSNRGSSHQQPPGVALPGGYTLIQLPVPGADGSTHSPGPRNLTCSQGRSKEEQVKSVSEEEPGSSIEMIVDENLSAGVSEASERLPGKPVDPQLEYLSSDSFDESDEDDELVDVETVEEVQDTSGVRMNNAPQRTPQLSRENESDDFKEDMKRQNHTKLERLRRCEQRILFEKLQTILRKDPKTPKLVLLSEAQEEIRSLVKTSKVLVKMKKMLTEVQSDYVKKLSNMSGRSESQIKAKLLEISLKQKARMKTDAAGSSLSKQTRAQAVVERVTSPPPATTPNQKLSTTEHSSSQHLLERLKLADTANDVSDENKGHSTEDQKEDSAEQSETKATSPCRPSQGSSKLLSFPLIRSKTGKIILPACVKQFGKGLVTFRLLKFRKTGEIVKVRSSAQHEDSSKNLETNTSASEQQLDSEMDCSSENKPTSCESVVLSPRGENPPEQRQKVFKGREGKQPEPVVYLQNSLSPQDPLFSGRTRYFVTTQTRDLINNKISTLAKEKVEKPKAGVREERRLTKNPPQAKRGRGRPRKRKSDHLHSAVPGKKVAKGSSKAKKDRSVSYTTVSAGLSKSRPLTRGSLGKDFPSAKKQSWIDVEKELEEDLDVC